MDDRIAWGLALWVALDMLDHLHNMPYRAPTLLIDGALLGGFAASARTPGPSPSAVRQAAGWSADPRDRR